ncbi:hypothetical protein [Sphingobium phenoxybenzoativorans]|nr:hypothetical protein [Sphingobium phenoxybenzoativorans]
MIDLPNYSDEIASAKAWYKSRNVYAGTAIGFALGLLVTWII